MERIIEPVDRKLIMKELTKEKFIRVTRKGKNFIYEITAHNSPNTMREIGRLRELSFRMGGGGTGKEIDIDEFDLDPVHPYRQLIVWDPKDREIIGGYRYIHCTGLDKSKMATTELFDFSDEFINDYMPKTIELGRSFVQPNYQSTNLKRKSLYALDNLWDGLGALMVKNPQIKYFFGKVTMYTTYNFRARNMLLFFLKKYFKDQHQLVRPITPLECDIDNPMHYELFNNLDYKDSYRVLQKELKNNGEHIPPLINSYMNLSPNMKVFGTAVNHGFGAVEETGILVSIPDIYPEKIERYITPMRLWVHRIRVRWWNRKEK